MRNWDLDRPDPARAGAADGAIRHRQHAEGDNAAQLVEHVGYIWLFAVSGLFMLRLLLDAFMVRRPLLEPNLGRRADVSRHLAVRVSDGERRHRHARCGRCRRLAAGRRSLRRRAASEKDLNTLRTHGPGFPLIYLLPHISTQSLLGDEGQQQTICHRRAPQARRQSRCEFVHVVTAA